MAAALAAFDPVWESLSLTERAQVLNLLIERIDYDGRTDDISVTAQPVKLRTLAEQLAEQESVA